MSWIKVFEHEEFGKIRLTDREGAPWFIARDVATSLGYKDVSKAVNKLCKRVVKFEAPNTLNPYNIIPESDVYRMVLLSKLPSAEKFQDWVVEVVLPTIRKTGSFSMTAEVKGTQKVQVSLELVATEFSAAKKIAADLGFVGTEVITKANYIVGQVTGVDVLKLAGHTPQPNPVYLNATELGKVYLGGASPHKVNKMLRDKGLQVKRGNKWYPTEEGAKYTVYTTSKSKTGAKFSNNRSWNVCVVDIIKLKGVA